jgi:cytochrome c556
MKSSPALARRLAVALIFPAVLLGAGCAKKQAAPEAASSVTAALPSGLAPTASILDLMLYPIDHHADELWEAVAIVSTVDGVNTIRPEKDEDWTALRQQALVLMESANLLVVEGRTVGHPGQKIEGPGEGTDYTPEQAQAEIDKDRGAFVAFAAALQAAAGGLVAAIDARDIDKYLDAGSALQEACEGCHRKYWYPNSALPPGL